MPRRRQRRQFHRQIRKNVIPGGAGDPRPASGGGVQRQDSLRPDPRIRCPREAGRPLSQLPETGSVRDEVFGREEDRGPRGGRIQARVQRAEELQGQRACGASRGAPRPSHQFRHNEDTGHGRAVRHIPRQANHPYPGRQGQSGWFRGARHGQGRPAEIYQLAGVGHLHQAVDTLRPRRGQEGR